MTTYEFVTTFSPEGYHCYGQNFVDSFVEHSEFPLTIYHESQGNVDFHKLLTWKNLDHDQDRQKFMEDWGGDKDKVGSAAAPNGQSIRFCHKVFAITDAIRNAKSEWVIWIHADVTITGKIDDLRMSRACPDGADLSFLGRPHFKYTECGFVGYRAASRLVQSMADDMRHYYTSGEIFSHPNDWWHDSKCFDVCRERSSIKPERQHSLTGKFEGDIHVWPHTCLSEWSKHQKGPRRKKKAYGRIVR